MTTCGRCGSVIPEGKEVAGAGSSAPILTICPSCAAAAGPTALTAQERPNLAGAAAAGLLFAMLASAVWYFVVVLTNYQLGIIAVAVGWLVGQAVMFGAGNKRGTNIQLLSVAITVLAMTVSEYLIVRQAAVQLLEQEGYTNIPLLFPAQTVAQVVIDGLRADPLTLIFWAIAAWTAFRVPAPARIRRAPA